MKITKDNIENLPIKDGNKLLLKALLQDVDEINHKSKKKIYIDWQDFHNEYSPEWTEPCPDFYGSYTIRRESDDDLIGVEMTIDTLDYSLCMLYDYLEII